jgi:phosphopantothenate-cysteine ligase/phosphopantothenoylcysteine decarboxylase/phosphopantothenate--cysteine ligase
MNLLVTAGNTQTPIDRVRCITNVFTGRTGAQIAARAYDRSHAVTLLTSHPDAAEAIPPQRPRAEPSWHVHTYRTFEDLDRHMAGLIGGGGFDAVIHCAAVNDYHVTGVFAPAPGTTFDPVELAWHADGPARVVDTLAGKVKSHHPELWLRLTPAPKLVDKVRTTWGFRGILVKFKLEVGATEEALLAIAEKSRVQSAADFMVANTLEGAADWALIGPEYVRVLRAQLADELLDRIEARAARPA